jgi:hypothetical protein
MNNNFYLSNIIFDAYVSSTPMAWGSPMSVKEDEKMEKGLLWLGFCFCFVLEIKILFFNGPFQPNDFNVFSSIPYSNSSFFLGVLRTLMSFHSLFIYTCNYYFIFPWETTIVK